MCSCWRNGTTTSRVRTLFLVVFVVFLLFGGCEGGRRKHAFIGNGGHFTGSSVTQIRTRAGGISREEDFIAKGKSKSNSAKSREQTLNTRGKLFEA